LEFSTAKTVLDTHDISEADCDWLVWCLPSFLIYVMMMIVVIKMGVSLCHLALYPSLYEPLMIIDEYGAWNDDWQG